MFFTGVIAGNSNTIPPPSTFSVLRHYSNICKNHFWEDYSSLLNGDYCEQKSRSQELREKGFTRQRQLISLITSYPQLLLKSKLPNMLIKPFPQNEGAGSLYSRTSHIRPSHNRMLNAWINRTAD